MTKPASLSWKVLVLPVLFQTMLEKTPRHLRAFLFYLVSISIIYAPVVFGGRTLSPALLQPHGAVDGWPYGYKGRTAVNTFNIDLPTAAWYELPVNKTVGDIYKRGELPLWNPYQAAGTPLAADYSTRAFFPYQILEDISPAGTWDFFILGRLLIAGFFSYLFLSLLGLSFQGAFLGGLFYMFSGSFVWFINLEQFTNVAMTLPVLLCSVELMIRRRGWREAAFLSVSSALVILAGQPEMALYVLFLGSSYFIIRSLSLCKNDAPALLDITLKSLLAFVTGLALAAPLILPFLDYVHSSKNLHPPGIGIGTQYVANWRKLFPALAPAATEIPADPALLPEVLFKHRDGFYRAFATKGAWDYLGGYTGIVPLFLGALGFLAALSGQARLRAMTIFFFSFGISIVLKNLGVKPFVWLGGLPLFDQAWSPRWAGPVWVFSFSAAGALGFEAISSSGDGGQKGSYSMPLTVFLIFSALISFFMLPGVLSLVLNRREIFSPISTPYIVPSVLLSHLEVLITLAAAFIITAYHLKTGEGARGLVALALLELWWNVPRGYDFRWLYLKIIPFSIGLAVTISFCRRSRLLALSLIAVFLASSLLMDLTSPRGLPQRTDVFNEAPYINFLKERKGRFRVAGGYGVLTPNYAGAFGLEDVRYINALVTSEYLRFRNEGLAAELPGEPESTSLWFTGMPQHIIFDHKESAGWYYRTVNRGMEEDFASRLPGYSMMGVKYLLMPSWFNMKEGPLKLVYDREIKIYENPHALPRSFVAYSFKAADRGYYLTGVDDIKEAKILEYGANEVLVEADAGRPGLLVLSDLYTQDWKAYIDGTPAELLMVNGVIRGVPVKEGTAMVLFRYEPKGFKTGSILFCAGLSAVLLFIIIPAFRS